MITNRIKRENLRARDGKRVGGRRDEQQRSHEYMLHRDPPPQLCTTPQIETMMGFQPEFSERSLLLLITLYRK